MRLYLTAGGESKRGLTDTISSAMPSALPHPPGCDQGNCSAEAFFSLMSFGYTIYPDTYFLDEDKERLENSPFFEERKIRRRTDCRGEPLN